MSAVSHISPVEELANFLAQRPTSEEIANFHLSPNAIARVRELLDKNNAGTITSEETHELDRLILLDDIIGLIQSRVPARVDNNREGAGGPQSEVTPNA